MGMIRYFLGITIDLDLPGLDRQAAMLVEDADPTDRRVTTTSEGDQALEL